MIEIAELLYRFLSTVLMGVVIGLIVNQLTALLNKSNQLLNNDVEDDMNRDISQVKEIFENDNSIPPEQTTGIELEETHFNEKGLSKTD